MRTSPLALTALLLLAACGREPPTQAQLEAARAQVESAMHAADRARSGLELLGLLPVYTCGEARRLFMGRALEAARAEVACARAEVQALDESTDALVLALPEEGCAVRGHTVRGQAVFSFRGGEDRFEVFADVRDLEVDGEALHAKVGYGTCGDETRYWAEAEGPLAHLPGHGYRIDAQVRRQGGLPLIGGTTLVLDGPGELRRPEGSADRVALTALHYELGHYLPSEGSVQLDTADGHRVVATFTTRLWRLGEVELEVDDHEPVTVPLVH